ncbi:MAG: PKD domain-containing protein [Nitrospiria bacterium]
MKRAKLNTSLMMILFNIIVIYGGHSSAFAGTWETKTPMPTGRFGMASGVVNGKIYTAGGFCCVPHTRMTVNEEYDPVTDTWTTKAPMPTQRGDLSGGSLNGLFYAVGGSGPFCCSSAHEAYDPVTDTWSIRAPMLTPRRALSVASVGGLLYAIGGFIDPTGGHRSETESYDPATNTWSTKAPMPTGRSHMGLAEINGKLCAVGGANNLGSLSILEVYDPATDSWTTKAPMPTPRGGLTVGLINNKLYVVGGAQNFAPSPTVNFLNTVEVYDPATDTWSTEAPIPTIRPGSAGQVVNDVLYVMGGADPSSTPLNVVEAFSVNRSPLANAGLDQTVHPGTLVTLDGSGSADPDGNVPLSYAWSMTAKPTESTATLANPTGVFPTFTPDLLGNYTVELVVTDSLGLASPPDQVVVSTFNSAPIADAGPDQAIIALGTMVQLDGSLSDDEDGDPITFSWSISAKPAGSAAVLNDPTLIGPSFVADVQGSYVVTLVVTDSFGAVSAPDTVTISFQNVKPVADAGNNQAAVVGDTVFMDGSGSSDANGDPLTYNWSIVSAPIGSAAALSDPTLAQTTLIPDVPGTYVVGLTVNDGFINSDPDTITITAVSVQDQATLLLTQAIDATNGLDDNVFKGEKKRKDNLTKKMGQAIEKVAKGDYLEAVEKIDSILNKMDGCATGGAPDSNDKILTCTAQAQVYPLLIQARGYLLTLL